LKQVDSRARGLVKTVFDAESRLFYMNGDHNNMGYIVGGFFESRAVKPVVIYLDIHSDARLPEDGPHSGTWLSEVFDRGECEKAYLIGMSLLSNSDAAIQNLEKNNVSFRDYSWDEIQRRGGSRLAIPLFTDQIIEDVRKRYGKDYPVIVSICADTVCGLPSSASNEVVGYPCEDVYPMMSELTKRLNVECLNVSELKPSLDKTKNLASGEFLQYSLYLYSQTLIGK
jgi:arginase family enzyme